ncbi:MAG: hypothetical protein RLN85_12970 [Pseudomonadales bacterium]
MVGIAIIIKRNAVKCNDFIKFGLFYTLLRLHRSVEEGVWFKKTVLKTI